MSQKDISIGTYLSIAGPLIHLSEYFIHILKVLCELNS